ncbi:hypothetical protein BRD17_00190 [Halobacteriales archaeon SW_7_68_16]|nr:MAG: hypothetical protein BRD17_00190 [Halobacteriales archaeon SW_7_68_16]
MFADGVIGAVAGSAGTIALTASLLVASPLGAFDVDAFADVMTVGIGGVVGSSVIVGYVIFVGAGMTIWPLLLASLGTFLPGDRYAARGVSFGLVIWTGFVVVFYQGYTGTALGLYVGLSMLGHVGYGYVTGRVFDYMFADRRPVIGRLLAPEETEEPGPAAGAAEVVTREGTETDTAEDGTADTAEDGTADTAGSGAAAGTATDGATASVSANDDTPSIDGPTADSGTAATAETTDDGPALEGVTVNGMPPLLQFDTAIRKIEASIDGEEPREFAELKRAYRGMVRSESVTDSKLSDLSNLLTGLRDRFPEDGSQHRWIDSMENRITQYFESRRRASEKFHLAGVGLYDDGVEVEAVDVRERTVELPRRRPVAERQPLRGDHRPGRKEDAGDRHLRSFGGRRVRRRGARPPRRPGVHRRHRRRPRTGPLSHVSLDHVGSTAQYGSGHST